MKPTELTTDNITETDRPREVVASLLRTPLAVARSVRLRAHELWADGEGGWTSNDRFKILRASNDDNLEVESTLADEVIDAVLGRLDVFKVNYKEDVSHNDIEDVGGWDLDNHDIDLMLEIDGLAFIDIEVEVDPLRLIEFLAKEIYRELATTDSEEDYYLVVDLITRLANACHEYKGETEDWIYLNKHGYTPEAIIVGAHWHGAEWHGGMSCPVYAMISATGQVFSPGMTSGPEPASTEHDVYTDLDRMAQAKFKTQDTKTS